MICTSNPTRTLVPPQPPAKANRASPALSSRDSFDFSKELGNIAERVELAKAKTSNRIWDY